MNTLERADIALGERIASKREAPVVRSAAKVGKLGDQGPLYAVGAALALAGLVAGNGRLARAGISVFIAVGGADAGKTLVKRCFHRTRPHVLLEEGHYESDAGGSEAKREQSFPSGHVAGTVAAARAISGVYPEAAPWSAVAALIIAGARLAEGAHWPLDVAAGAVIGLATELATSRGLRWLGHRFG